MNNSLATGIATLALLAGAASAQAQVAGSTRLAVTRGLVATVEVREFAAGWSARKQILGHAVVNEDGECVGRITDLLVTPDGAVSHAIVGAGGFLGLGRHDVAIPVALLEVAADKVVLRGATRDDILALPPFEYAR